MKSRFVFVLAILAIVASREARAQFGEMGEDSPKKGQQQMFEGGLGVTFIDGQAYYLFNLMPELSFGKLGIGFDLNLRVNSTTGKIRTQDYTTFSDYLRVIRYVRWSHKGTPLYLRFGVLDYSRLGHGFIMYNYRNSASYDLRKWGMEFDMDFERFGFESVYSDVAGRDGGGVLGLRGYVRPLKFTPAGKIPIIGGFEIGGTYAADYNSNANVTADALGNPVQSGNMSEWGIDFGLPLLSLSAIKSNLYYDIAQIVNYGHGSAVGIDLYLGGGGLLSLGAKYERRFMGDQFLPSYFDALYEKDRYMPPAGTAPFYSKAQMLKYATAGEGYYGELRISVLNSFHILGGYYAPIGVDNQGTFHAILETPNVIPSIIIRGGLDKRNIGQVFVLDQNSLLYAEIGYKPVPFMIVSTLYEWTFTRDDNGNLVSQKRIEPKVSFVFNF